MRYFPLAVFLLATVHAGPYPPAAGSSGTDAIAKDDSRFVSWASGYQPPVYGTDVDTEWRTPAKALGPATGDTFDIVCLGNGGKMTLFFPHPVQDGAGADFAIFENGFSNTFLELAFVEVSSDGVNFVRFPTVSLTPSPVGPYSITGMNATDLSGFAGKYRAGFGTPFDLATLPASPLLDRSNVRFVRLVDVIGDGATKDSLGNPIYDPTPSIGSGGFDLDAIGVIHQNDGAFRVTRAEATGGAFQISWESNPGSNYRVETSITLSTPPAWQQVVTTAGKIDAGITSLSLALDGPRRFWRVLRVP